MIQQLPMGQRLPLQGTTPPPHVRHIAGKQQLNCAC